MKSLDAYVAYLAQRHARDQEEIAAQLAVALFPLWTMVKFQDLSGSMPAWLASVLPRIKTAYTQSQRVSAIFAQNVRFASLPLETPLPISVPDVERPHGLSVGAFDMPDLGTEKLFSVSDAFDTERVSTSLIIQADYNTKKQMPGPEQELMDNALVRSSGTAVKEVVNGSRGVINNINLRDKRTIGYARVTDSDPCAFCALLASRGAVYTSESFLQADQNFTPNPNGAKNLPEGFSDVAKVHDNCRCTLRPVYAKSQAMDAAAKYYRDAWDDIYNSNSRLSNKKQINEFRKWLNKNPYQGSQLDIHQIRQDLQKREIDLLQAGFSHDSPQVKWAARQLENFAA